MVIYLNSFSYINSKSYSLYTSQKIQNELVEISLTLDALVKMCPDALDVHIV